MSTIGGLLLAASASWGHDIYERHLNPRASRSQALRAGQLAVVVVAVGAATVALAIDPSNVSDSTPSVIAALVTAAFALAGTTLTPSLVLGIWWKRTTATAVIIGMVLGAVLTITAIFAGLANESAPRMLQTPTILVGPLVSAVIIGVSLVTAKVPDIEPIWVRMHGSANDRQAERLARMTLEAASQ